MKWIDAAPDFAWDGSWRDIYILNTSLDDWQRVVDSLRGNSPPPRLLFDGASVPIPSSIKSVFERGDDESRPVLHLKAGNISLKCHFFDIGEIEFDLDPREVLSEKGFGYLTTFMSQIANAAGKPAILTHENVRDAVIVNVQPSA
ncbi:MAG: hypothetical protein EON89_11840 [Brevundimonas sp.]|nr:MAG: hypothetical protein EON89_11840 [Brevundimonas sp.]